MLIWQPEFGVGAVAVYLDRSFAERCRNHPETDRHNFPEVIRSQLRPLGYSSVQPGHLVDWADGILPKGFYPRGDGLWLTLGDIPSDPGQAFFYHSHNADHRLWQHLLLQIFGAWANLAAAAIGWE